MGLNKHRQLIKAFITSIVLTVPEGWRTTLFSQSALISQLCVRYYEKLKCYTLGIEITFPDVLLSYLHVINTEMYSEPVIYFRKTLHLRCLIGFWIHLWNFPSVICIICASKCHRAKAITHKRMTVELRSVVALSAALQSSFFCVW